MITALNKIDLLEDQVWLEKLKNDFPNSLSISAKLQTNLGFLCAKIQENLISKMTDLELMIPHSRMDLVNLFYLEGKVEEIEYLQKGIKVKLSLPKIIANKLLQNKEIEQVD